MNVIPLDWDSAFFGLRIAKVILAEGEGDLRLSDEADSLRERFDLVYVFSPVGGVHPTSSMRLVDRKATFSIKAPFHPFVCPAVKRWNHPEVTEELMQLALASGQYSRFRLDDRFPRGSYERLYSHWIRQSVSGQIATDVFCFYQNDLPVGLATLDLDSEEGHVGLVAVDEAHRGQGIGRCLMEHVIGFCRQHPCKQLSVITQLDNLAACRLYERCGFHLESVQEVWHWWL